MIKATAFPVNFDFKRGEGKTSKQAQYDLVVLPINLITL
jgi:hypothetical protein